MEVRYLTVGVAQENTWIIRRDGSDTGLLIDPGDEPDRIKAALADLGVTKVEAILLTHCHFDHVGAVAPMAEATGAPVFCPKLEVPLLADIMAWVPWPGIGPFESYDADETLEGGEKLTLAGLDIEIFFVPGHSPGHLAYSIPSEGVLLSGDVLFQGSIGRTDLPGGDHPTMLRSLRDKVLPLADDVVVLPGHGEQTSIGRERGTNPYLLDLSDPTTGGTSPVTRGL
jgi:glyoxylase-like metal-dependent hydrolase (beta-lactamase superfamily II)